MPARLELIVGPMFSGKTERLLAKLARAQYAQKRILVLKPAHDTRTGSFIASRAVTGAGSTEMTGTFPAALIATRDELVAAIATDGFDVLAVDEAQFFPLDEPASDSLGWFGHEIRSLMHRRRDDSLLVLVAGLDRDFADTPFGPVAGLLAIADHVEKLSAVCMQCGSDDARLSQRVADTGKQVSVGDVREYQSRCRACYVAPPDTLSYA